MNKIFFLFLLFPLYLFSVDADFDGVEDDVDACLGTDILDTVTADGCSENQKSKFNITLLQTYSYLDIDDSSSIDNYSLALMLSKDSWLVYVGSGYFKYDNPRDTIKDFGDTTLLVQKTFALTPNHYVKSSFFTALPTYDEEGNNVDYGMDISYSYLYKNFNAELGYQYDWINDDNSDDVQSAYLYLGYRLTDSVHTIVGYNEDSEKRKNKLFLLQYRYSDAVRVSYSFTKGEDNFYDKIHSFGLGYSF